LHPDVVVGRVAGRQHGVIGVGQLLAAGLTRAGISHRVKTGRLHRLHQGVYAVGDTALPPLGPETAALLACGPGAVLSHWSALALWGLGRADTAVHVTITEGQRRNRPGVVVHRPASLDPRDVGEKERLRMTRPARTILDLANHMSAAALERVVAEALARRLVTTTELERRGGERLRAILDRGPRLTRSAAERKLLSLVRDARLPRPETNVKIHGYEVDALWRSERLAVEFDSYAFHGSRLAFERDRGKDLVLDVRGLDVIRVSWRQLTNEPLAVAAAIARRLPRAAG
jgi:very-short-patch-repair endonuclease